MRISLIRFAGGHSEVPAHIREKMATNWYVRHFNSYTIHGRANSVMAVLSGWLLFGFTMSRWVKSRKAKRLASQSSTSAASPSISSSTKGGHH